MTQIPILNGMEFLHKNSYAMPMAGEFYVYEHIRKDTGQPFYVGKGKKRRAFNGGAARRNQWWINIVAKSGGFEVNFLHENLSESEALEKEKEAIAHYRNSGIILVNMTDGGDGLSGYKRTDEWRAMMSRVHKGKVISPEVRAKISASVKASGYTHSEEARRKMSEAHKGKQRALGYKHTEEWKAWSSIARKGNKSRTGQTRSPEERAKASASLSGRVQNILVCPHCLKRGGNIMRRYHFDNCKQAAENANTSG
jgi:hypothetical protein